MGAESHEPTCDLGNEITFYGQSGVTDIAGGKHTNENLVNTTSDDHAATTTFVDALAVVSSTVAVPKPMSTLEIRDQYISDFLNKPKLLANVSWTTANTEGTVIYALNEVGTLLNNVTEWNYKIKGFGLVRGTFVLRVQINASPFQAGSMIIHAIPNLLGATQGEPNFIKRVNKNLMQKLQHPHVFLTTNETAAEMRLPFIAGPDYFDLKQPSTAGFGYISAEVATPLRVGAGSLTYVDVSVYGFWEDFELAAPTIGQSSMKSKLVRKPVNKREAAGPVTDGLNKVAKVADAFSSIPGVSTVADAVGWTARFASNLTSIFGWSKPIMDDKVVPFSNQILRYAATSEGTDTSVPLGVLHDNLTPAVHDYTMYACDEMSLKFLGSIQHYYTTLTWNVATPTDTSLLSLNLNPQSLGTSYIDTVGLKSIVYYGGGPLAYLARCFQLWRGSLNVHMKFIKTKFHSGRIQITWTPGTHITTSPTTSDSLYSLRQIVDIREQDELVLNLPYLVPAKWLNNNGALAAYQTTSGRLDVLVLNDLRAPESCGQTIDILVSFTAGDDFEFAVPSRPLQGKGFGVYTPQSDSAVTIVRAGIADSKVEGPNVDIAASTVGEKIMSLKQLLMRLTFPQTRNAYVWTNALSHSVNPWFVGGNKLNSTTGAHEVAQYFGDALSMIAPMYLNFKGGYNFALFNPSTTKKITGYTFPKTNGVGVANMVEGTNLSLGFMDSLDRDVGQFISASSLEPTGAAHYYKIPYYSRYPVSTVRVSTVEGGTTECITSPINVLGLSGPAVLDGATSFGRAASDDFQLCMFICAPFTSGTYSG